MSNAEIWRSSIERFHACRSRAEWEEWIERESAIWDPEIEWDFTAVDAPDIHGTRFGIEAGRHFFRQWFDAWETLEFSYELIEKGDDVVLLVDQRMRGRSSGIEVPMGEYGQVATFRDGRMIRWRIFPSQEAALAAVGVRG